MGSSANSSSFLILCLCLLVFTQKSLAYFVTVSFWSLFDFDMTWKLSLLCPRILVWEVILHLSIYLSLLSLFFCYNNCNQVHKLFFYFFHNIMTFDRKKKYLSSLRIFRWNYLAKIARRKYQELFIKKILSIQIDNQISFSQYLVQNEQNIPKYHYNLTGWCPRRRVLFRQSKTRHKDELNVWSSRRRLFRYWCQNRR